MSKRWLLLLVFVLILTAKVFAVGESKFKYEGEAVYSDGTVVPDGIYAMRFQLWDVPSGDDMFGNLKWQETYVESSAVEILNGCFTVELGSLSVFPDTLFDGDIWLDVLIDPINIWGGEYESLGERKLLPSVPFSFSAIVLTEQTILRQQVMQIL